MSRVISKNNRVLGLIALMAASSFAVGGGVVVVTTRDATELTAAISSLTDMRILAHQLSTAIQDQEAAVDDFVLSKNPSALVRFDESVAIARDILAEVRLATADLPRLRFALEAVESVSLEWRQQVASPAFIAVARADNDALARFAASAGDDHAARETALEALDSELLAASDDVADRQAGVATTTTIGVTLAFGFLLLAFGVALIVVRRFGHALEHDARHSGVLNRFTEVTSFASDDHEVARANLIALGRLARPDASVTHVLNRSMDRAVPEASTGQAIAEVLPLHALGRCAGVLRGTMYVTDDLTDELSVRCPIYPADRGTLACIPLISGESVGAVHLYWARPNALPLAARPSLARITEHAALAIGNRRLLAALHGQANTDPRTGLANSRAFDLAMQEALSARSSHEVLSVLMIDVDNFKQFNDLHGHPAGDEALRAFGGVLRSCMRDGDVAARYGGEEFAVLLRGNDAAVAAVVAERIRSRTEATIIALAPGMTDKITVSIGIASAPDQGLDRVTLLRVADEALYQAKATGRNRVVGSAVLPGVVVPTRSAGSKRAAA